MAANDYYAGAQNFPPHPQGNHAPPPPYNANYAQAQQPPPRVSPQPESKRDYYPPPQPGAPWQQAYNSHHYPSQHYYGSAHQYPPQVCLRAPPQANKLVKANMCRATSSNNYSPIPRTTLTPNRPPTKPTATIHSNRTATPHNSKTPTRLHNNKLTTIAHISTTTIIRNTRRRNRTSRETAF